MLKLKIEIAMVVTSFEQAFHRGLSISYEEEIPKIFPTMSDLTSTEFLRMLSGVCRENVCKDALK